MNLKMIAVIALLLQALALPVTALADQPQSPPTRGINFTAGNLSFPNWNVGYCYYGEAAGDTYYFWLYNSANQFVAVFFTKEAIDVTLLAHECGNAHWIQLYCPDANCEWTALLSYPYGVFYNGAHGY